MAKLIKSKFLKSLDTYLLLNHPFLWVSRIHYITFYGLILLLGASTIAYFFPFKINNPPNTGLIFIILLIFYLFLFLFWILNLSDHNENHFYPKRGISHEILKYFTFLYITLIFIGSPFIIIHSISSNMLSEDVKNDIHLLKELSFLGDWEQKNSKAIFINTETILPITKTLIKYKVETEKKKNSYLKAINKFHREKNCFDRIKSIFEKTNLFETGHDLELYLNRHKIDKNKYLVKGKNFNLEDFVKFTNNKNFKLDITFSEKIKDLLVIQNQVKNNVDRITLRYLRIIKSERLTIFNIWKIFFFLVFIAPALILDSRISDNASSSQIVLLIFAFYILLSIGNQNKDIHEKEISNIIFLSIILLVYLLSLFMIVRKKSFKKCSYATAFSLTIFVAITPWVFLLPKPPFSGHFEFSFFWFLAGVMLYIIFLPFIKKRQDMLNSLPKRSG